MRDYRVLYAYGSGDQIARIRHQMDPAPDIDSYSSFRFPTCGAIPLVIIPVDLTSLGSADEFHNICGSIQQQLTVFSGIGFHTGDKSSGGPTVNVCKRIWWPNFLVGDDGQVQHVSNDHEEIGWRKRAAIDLFAKSPEWPKWYTALGHNDEPTYIWTDCLLVPAENLSNVTTELRKRPEIGVIDRRCNAHPDLHLFKDWSSAALFAPAEMLGPDTEFDGDSSDGMGSESAIDALLALVNYIAFQDSNSQGPPASPLGALPGHPSSHASVQGEVVFSGEEARRRVADFRFISKRLPFHSIRILKVMKGSVRVEVQLHQTDLLVLDALFSSGIYQHLARDRSQKRDYFEAESRHMRWSAKNQPIFMLEYADHIEWLGESATGPNDLEAFEQRWNRYQVLRPLTRLITKSKSLYGELSRCG